MRRNKIKKNTQDKEEETSKKKRRDSEEKTRLIRRDKINEKKQD